MPPNTSASQACPERCGISNICVPHGQAGQAITEDANRISSAVNFTPCARLAER